MKKQQLTAITSLSFLLALTLLSNTLVAATAADLQGTWECQEAYESHSLRFISANQLEFDGEVLAYEIQANALVVDYEGYPYRFEGDTLTLTIEGSDYRFKRVAAKPQTNTKQDPKAILGFWKSKTEWGTQYLHVVSNTQLEFGGHRIAYSLAPGVIRAQGSEFPYALKDDILTLTIPEEGQKITFTRDSSLLLGAWIADRDGQSVSLIFHSDKELEFAGEPADYQLVPGAIQCDGMDHPYHIDGKAVVVEIDGTEIKFQRDPQQLMGAWEAKTSHSTVSIMFKSEKELEYDGEAHAYTLTPGSIQVDNLYVPYRLHKDSLMISIPDEGDLTFRKVKKVDAPKKPSLQGTWQAKNDWETITLKFLSASQLEDERDGLAIS
ncbi:hypothetical protein ACFL6U_32070, partial [Planctomycetota bacterium]